jgi:hypothetical protein
VKAVVAVRAYAAKAKWKDSEQPLTWILECVQKYVPSIITEFRKVTSH